MNQSSISDHALWRTLHGLTPEPCILSMNDCYRVHIDALMLELADLREFRGTLRKIMRNESFGQKTKTKAWQLMAETKIRMTLIHEELEETRKCLD